MARLIIGRHSAIAKFFANCPSREDQNLNGRSAAVSAFSVTMKAPEPQAEMEDQNLAESRDVSVEATTKPRPQMPEKLTWCDAFMFTCVIFNVRFFGSWAAFSYYSMWTDPTTSPTYHNIPIIAWIMIAQQLGVVVGSVPSFYFLRKPLSRNTSMISFIVCYMWIILVPTAVFTSQVPVLQFIFLGLGSLPYVYTVGLLISFTEGRTKSEEFAAVFLNGSRSGAMVGTALGFGFQGVVGNYEVPVVVASVSIVQALLCVVGLYMFPSLTKEDLELRGPRDRGSPDTCRFFGNFWFQLSVIILAIAVCRAWMAFRVAYFYAICFDFLGYTTSYLYSFLLTITNIIGVVVASLRLRFIADHVDAYHESMVLALISFGLLAIFNGVYFAGLPGFAWLALSEFFVGFASMCVYCMLERLIAGTKSNVSMVNYYMPGEIFAAVLGIAMFAAVTASSDYYDTFYAGTACAGFGTAAGFLLIMVLMYRRKKSAMASCSPH